MRTFNAIFLLLVCFPAAAAQARPNIVLFVVDDMGWLDCSVPFGERVMELNEIYRTPNLERLAQSGITFTQAYATPVCTPSRVSLMTGLNAAHHRVTNWTSLLKDDPSDNDHSNYPVAPPEWNCNGYSPVEGVPRSIHATPLPERLRSAGYYTIHVGKAHFAAAGTPGSSPYNLGFLVNIAGNMAGMPQSYYGAENFGNIPGESNLYAIDDLTEYYQTDTYLTEALTREAIRSLEHPVENQQPFFLHLAHYAVHQPLQPDPQFTSAYQQQGLDAEQVTYASMLTGMDKSLGDVMQFLEDHGIEDNTIILFVSDNGGRRRAPGSSKSVARTIRDKRTHNLPLREGKGSVYEGGIRVPMIVKWPGVAQPNSRSDHPVMIEDFFPTLLDLAEVDDRETIQEIDGQSFAPILEGAELDSSERLFVWHFPHKWLKSDNPDIDFLSAVRRNDWKLVYNMSRKKLELYNLREDVGELVDVAHEHPERVRQMAATWSQRLREWGAQLPIEKSTGEPVPWPDQLQ